MLWTSKQSPGLCIGKAEFALRDTGLRLRADVERGKECGSEIGTALCRDSRTGCNSLA